MIPFISLTIHVRQHHDLHLPEHAGSMLRGAFGNALKRLACMTKQPDCTQCPLYQSCSYTRIFETPIPFMTNESHKGQIVNPYVIKPPAMGVRIIPAGENWHFGLTVIGQACDQLPLIVYAFEKACERGFSKENSRSELLEIRQDSDVVYKPNMPLLARRSQLTIPELGERIRLRFITPLRLQGDNTVIIVPEQITAELLLNTLARRVQRFMDLHTYDKPQLNLAQIKQKSQSIYLEDVVLKRCDVTRYSSRQKRLITEFALLGSMTLVGNWHPFAELLALGEYIHVGKNATQGLGEYVLEVV